MSTDEVLAELERRGLTIALDRGRPVLVGPRSRASATLLAVLRWHRDAIARRLAESPPAPPAPAPTPQAAPAGPREWLWRDGHRYTECPDDARFLSPDHHPGGAWWFRHAGEAAWRPVPGRGADVAGGVPPPAAAGDGPPGGGAVVGRVPGLPARPDAAHAAVGRLQPPARPAAAGVLVGLPGGGGDPGGGDRP